MANKWVSERVRAGQWLSLNTCVWACECQVWDWVSVCVSKRVSMTSCIFCTTCSRVRTQTMWDFHAASVKACMSVRFHDRELECSAVERTDTLWTGAEGFEPSLSTEGYLSCSLLFVCFSAHEHWTTLKQSTQDISQLSFPYTKPASWNYNKYFVWLTWGELPAQSMQEAAHMNGKCRLASISGFRHYVGFVFNLPVLLYRLTYIYEKESYSIF